MKKVKKRRNKLTLDFILPLLTDKQMRFVDVSDYKGVNIPAEFECLVDGCGHKWPTSLNHLIYRNDKCPKCARKIEYTNEVVDERLIGRPIKRLGECFCSETKIWFQCLEPDCLHKWEASPGLVVGARNPKNNTGCPECGGSLPLPPQEVDERLAKKNINLLDKFINVDQRAKAKCLVEGCGYEWTTSVDNLLRGSHCAKCADKAPVTDEEAARRLIGRDIIILGGIHGMQSPATFKCLNCQHEWTTLANSVLRGSGCSVCSSGVNEKLVYSLLTQNSIKFEYQKRFKKIYSKTQKNMKVDFYIPAINTIIEYNGEQHYNPVKFGEMTDKQLIEKFAWQQERDAYLDKICKENNIGLITINGMIYHSSKLTTHMNNIIIPQIQKMITAQAA